MGTRKWKKNDEYWKVMKEVDMKCKHIDNDELREHESMKIVRRQKMIKTIHTLEKTGHVCE